MPSFLVNTGRYFCFTLQSCERKRHWSLEVHWHYYAGFIAHSSPFLFLSFQGLCFLKEAPGTQHKVYSVCVFLIIGSKVTQGSELLQRTPKTVWIQPLCSHAPQAFVDVLQHDCPDSTSGLQGRFMRLFSRSKEHLGFANMLGICTPARELIQAVHKRY